MSAEPRPVQPLRVQRAGGAGRGGAVIKQGNRSVFIPAHMLPQIASALTRVHDQNAAAAQAVRYTTRSSS